MAHIIFSLIPEISGTVSLSVYEEVKDGYEQHARYGEEIWDFSFEDLTGYLTDISRSILGKDKIDFSDVRVTIIYCECSQETKALIDAVYPCLKLEVRDSEDLLASLICQNYFEDGQAVSLGRKSWRLKLSDGKFNHKVCKHDVSCKFLPPIELLPMLKLKNTDHKFEKKLTAVIEEKEKILIGHEKEIKKLKDEFDKIIRKDNIDFQKKINSYDLIFKNVLQSEFIICEGYEGKITWHVSDNENIKGSKNHIFDIAKNKNVTGIKSNTKGYIYRILDDNSIVKNGDLICFLSSTKIDNESLEFKKILPILKNTKFKLKKPSSSGFYSSLLHDKNKLVDAVSFELGRK